MMNTIIGLWFLAAGLVGVVRPTFYFRSEKLSPVQVERNRRIWRLCGAGLMLCGTGVLIVQFLGH